MEEEVIKVRASGSLEEFQVNAVAFRTLSKVFAEMLNHVDPKSEADVITLNINPEILPHVVEFVQRKFENKPCGDPIHGEEEDMNMKYMCMHDKTFIRRFRLSDIYLLAQAAQYLEIESLHRLCVKVLHFRLEGRNTAEMRAAMSLENDFTNFEENLARKENEWCLNLKTMKF